MIDTHDTLLPTAKTVFAKYDDDGSGTLGAEELNRVLVDLGVDVTPQFLEDAIERLDDDGSGELSFDEFMPWWTAETRRRKNDRLASARDTDGKERRHSEQLELSLKDNAYLKMSAQRERNLQASENHLKSILSAIASDFQVDQDEFMEKYCIAQGDLVNEALLQRKQSIAVAV